MLISIYGKTVVNSLVDLSNGTIIRLKDPARMNEFIETYARARARIDSLCAGYNLQLCCWLVIM